MKHRNGNGKNKILLLVVHHLYGYMWPPKIINWLIFFVLCLIWGSSFILMKLGLFDNENLPLLSAYQVAAIRILSAGLVLTPFVIIQWKTIPFTLVKWMVLSGVWGSFIPAFLFCIAETKIDSGLAGTLNALTPIFVIIMGFIIYGTKVAKAKIVGIAIGFIGSVLLFVTQKHQNLGQISYAGLAIIATIFYGINVNMVRYRLNNVPSTTIASVAFVWLIIPAAFVLWFTGYFALPLGNKPYLIATAASSLLGVLGTAVASILFYILVKRAGAIFASLVTYGIPFVALGWGFLYGEAITLVEVICLLVILCGVYIANMNFKAIRAKVLQFTGKE